MVVMDRENMCCYLCVTVCTGSLVHLVSDCLVVKLVEDPCTGISKSYYYDVELECKCPASVVESVAATEHLVFLCIILSRSVVFYFYFFQRYT